MSLRHYRITSTMTVTFFLFGPLMDLLSSKIVKIHHIHWPYSVLWFSKALKRTRKERVVGRGGKGGGWGRVILTSPQ